MDSIDSIYWISVTSNNLQLSFEYVLTYYFNPYLEYLKYCKPYFYVLKARVNNIYTLQKEWCFIIFQNYVLSFCITISLVSKMATSVCYCCGVHKQQPWSDIAFWKISIGADICQYLIDVVSYVHFSCCILNVSEFQLNVYECFAEFISKG